MKAPKSCNYTYIKLVKLIHNYLADNLFPINDSSYRTLFSRDAKRTSSSGRTPPRWAA